MNPIAENYIPQVGDVQLDVNTEDGSCLFSAQVFDEITTANSNLEEELSVFETVEEEQDYSMSFDGAEDYITINDISIAHSNTISFFAKKNNNESDQPSLMGGRVPPKH